MNKKKEKQKGPAFIYLFWVGSAHWVLHMSSLCVSVGWIGYVLGYT